MRTCLDFLVLLRLMMIADFLHIFQSQLFLVAIVNDDVWRFCDDKEPLACLAGTWHSHFCGAPDYDGMRDAGIGVCERKPSSFLLSSVSANLTPEHGIFHVSCTLFEVP